MARPRRTGLALAQIVKGLISCVLAAHEYQYTASTKKVDDVDHKYRETPSLAYCLRLTVVNAFTVHRGDFAKLLVPAVLYAAQNNLIVGHIISPVLRLILTMYLQYIALSNLPVAVYQATYQLKILTTAIFSVILLKRRYSALKWLSLLLLTAGVCVVQTPSSQPAKNDGHEQDRLTGFLALAAACLSSGLAGAFFE